MVDISCVGDILGSTVPTPFTVFQDGSRHKIFSPDMCRFSSCTATSSSAHE